MSGFGAILKTITRAIDVAASAVDRGFRSALRIPRPKLRPIAIPVEYRRRRR